MRRAVLVSGGSGVIGRRVVRRLQAAGCQVTILSRSAAPPGGPTSGDDVRRVRASLFDPDALREAVAGQDAVINLATHIPGGLRQMFRSAWRENDRVRSEGAANLAQACALAGVRLLIQESFAYAYPDQGAAWIDEEVPLAPTDQVRSVLDAEAAARRFGDTGRRAVILRFAAFYGPDADQTRLMAKAVARGLAPLPGAPTSFMSSVSHDDAAAAVVAALEAPSGAYNVADDEPVTHAAFARIIAETLGARPPHFLPSWAARLMGAPARTLARSIRLTNAKLKTATSWKPAAPTVAEGLPPAVRAALAQPP